MPYSLTKTPGVFRMSAPRLLPLVRSIVSRERSEILTGERDIDNGLRVAVTTISPIWNVLVVSRSVRGTAPTTTPQASSMPEIDRVNFRTKAFMVSNKKPQQTGTCVGVRKRGTNPPSREGIRGKHAGRSPGSSRLRAAFPSGSPIEIGARKWPTCPKSNSAMLPERNRVYSCGAASEFSRVMRTALQQKSRNSRYRHELWKRTELKNNIRQGPADVKRIVRDR